MSQPLTLAVHPCIQTHHPPYRMAVLSQGRCIHVLSGVFPTTLIRRGVRSREFRIAWRRMNNEWPLSSTDRCESNGVIVPYVSEFFSSITALVIMITGLVPLVKSKYPDELVDLANAMMVINGAASALAHGSALRIFGQADAFSIHISVLLFLKGLIMADCPVLYQAPGW